MNETIAILQAAALAAVNPAQAIERVVNRTEDRLNIAVGGASPPENRASYRLDEWEIRCLAVGKAAVPMAGAILDRLGDRIARGSIVTKDGHLGAIEFPAGWETIEAGHPTPDERSLHAGDRVENFLANGTNRTLIIACISGGASALVTAPRSWQSLQQLLAAPPSESSARIIHAALSSLQIDLATVDARQSLPLDVVRAINTGLLDSGLDIERINAVRTQLDRLKGGGLVKCALPGQVVGLILSDVIGDSIAAIASGLTNHPAATNLIVGSNERACAAVAATATKLGYQPQIVTTTLAGEAQVRGREIVREILLASPKTVLIYGGETTVTLPPKCLGKGGRNQELALAAAIELSTQSTSAWVATLATDGTDGPTDAAGATVDERTIGRALALGLDANLALDLHDSYHFFDRSGNLVRLGATGTNVADITIAIRDER
jgi:glycerate 2-kinase